MVENTAGKVSALAVPACRPNISEAGKRRRLQFGWVALVLTAAVFVGTVALKSPWYLRALVFLPAAAAAFGFLQVRRDTCVARAREGTFEHEDFSKTQAAPEDAAASRRVAATIERDALLAALLIAAVAAATAWFT